MQGEYAEAKLRRIEQFGFGLNLLFFSIFSFIYFLFYLFFLLLLLVAFFFSFFLVFFFFFSQECRIYGI